MNRTQTPTNNSYINYQLNRHINLIMFNKITNSNASLNLKYPKTMKSSFTFKPKIKTKTNKITPCI